MKMELYEKQNKGDDFKSFKSHQFRTTYQHLPDGNLTLEFRPFGKNGQFLGFNSIEFDTILMEIYNKVGFVNRYIDKKYANIEIIEKIEHGVLKQEIVKILKKDYELHSEKITKQEISQNPELLNKLLKCSHRITSEETGDVYYNFVKSIPYKKLRKDRFYWIEHQKHFYWDFVANHICNHLYHYFYYPKIFTHSHPRIGFYNHGHGNKNGFYVTHHFGITSKEKIISDASNDDIPYGLLDNRSYFDGNLFALELPIELKPKFLKDYGGFTELKDSCIISNELGQLHGKATAIASISRPITSDMSDKKKAKVKHYNDIYIPKIAHRAAKKEKMGRKMCSEPLIEEIINPMFDLLLAGNTNYVVNHGVDLEDIKKAREWLNPASTNSVGDILSCFLNFNCFNNDFAVDCRTITL